MGNITLCIQCIGVLSKFKHFGVDYACMVVLIIVSFRTYARHQILILYGWEQVLSVQLLSMLYPLAILYSGFTLREKFFANFVDLLLCMTISFASTVCI